MSGSQTAQANGLALPTTNGMPTPSAGWTGTIVRVIFGIIFGIDAYLKWLPGYRETYISQLKSVAHGQPSWLHGWFRFWITIQSSAPTLFAVFTGIAETGLGLCLLLGLARRLGYTAGAIYTLLIWAVGEASAALHDRNHRCRDRDRLCPAVRHAARLRAARAAGAAGRGPAPRPPLALVAFPRRAARDRPGPRRPARRAPGRGRKPAAHRR